MSTLALKGKRQRGDNSEVDTSIDAAKKQRQDSKPEVSTSAEKADSVAKAQIHKESDKGASSTPSTVPAEMPKPVPMSVDFQALAQAMMSQAMSSTAPTFSVGAGRGSGSSLPSINPQEVLNEAQRLCAAGKYEESILYANKFLSENFPKKLRFDLLILQGSCIRFLSIKNPFYSLESAIATYKDALRLASNDYDKDQANFEMANAYYMMGKFPDAITHYNKVRVIRLTKPTLYQKAQYNVAIILEKMGEPPSSIKPHLCCILESGGSDKEVMPLALSMLKRVIAQQAKEKEKPKPLTIPQKPIAAGSDPKGHIPQGQKLLQDLAALLGQKKYAEVIAGSEKAFTLQLPEDMLAEVIRMKGVALFGRNQEGDVSEAVMCLEFALTFKTSNLHKGIIAYHLATILNETDKGKAHATALKAFQLLCSEAGKAITGNVLFLYQEGQQSRYLALTQELLARLYLFQGKPSDAKGYFLAALRSNETDPEWILAVFSAVEAIFAKEGVVVKT